MRPAILDTDCRASVSRKTARGKLRALGAGAEIIRKELSA
ncbi:methionine synthase II (cobalamin-independent) [Paenochrobactrum gallinarii]|uniref:Methionine synthase II (Cobalamin-independent) n=1 Tax=Paenochrobactrum gallinarii TaxID=643673 RepID=A0A841LVF7_9HYPH|nr:methionine synthase II (cobalamin-independent) [Paenochrobactrum gallinarii]